MGHKEKVFQAQSTNITKQQVQKGCFLTGFLLKLITLSKIGAFKRNPENVEFMMKCINLYKFYRFKTHSPKADIDKAR